MPAAGAAPPQTPLGRTYLLVFLTTVFWGGTAVAGKIALRDFPPLSIGVFRYGVAGLILAAAFRREIPPFSSLRRADLWVLLWVGILGITLNHALFFLALIFAPAAHGAIIPTTTSPVWTIILAARLGREPVTGRQVLGMFLCLVGVLLVVRPERIAAGAGAPLGDLLFLVGGIAWGIYSYISKVAMRRLSAVATLVFGMGIGTAALLPLALAERPWNALRAAGAEAWGALAYLTFLGSLVSFFWWNLAIRRLGAGRTAVFSNLIPVFGVLLSWLVLGERLAPSQLGGGGLAILGVLACQGPILRGAFARRG
ncbi:MAG TPA: DMT family transporter [Candidatus Sulfotelmatobacter sp.]|nr:DMT family transporter [Candidatus Sulfotelmatobacter sp.]